MKILLAILTLATSHAFAVECSGNLEAEFIGKVDVVQHFSNITEYSIKDISFYNENPLCPLDESEALNAGIRINADVELSSGQDVSGVLVYNPTTRQFTIE